MRFPIHDEEGNLTMWEPSQWVGGARQIISQWMGIDVERIRVISPYVGGGIGSKVTRHPHVALAVAAARALDRPVKLTLSRPQTFTGFGGRAATRQKLSLGASADGKLLAIVQEGSNETAIDDIGIDPCNAVTPIMYASPNLSVKLRLRNWAEEDPPAKIPWGAQRLREAYEIGAQAFGWHLRNPHPR
jgi:xanthine dehydrogenase YagR molybdenum-binding subunit